jgi:hypothetical protein
MGAAPRKAFKDVSTLRESVAGGKKLTITHYNTSSLFKIDDEVIATEDNIIYQFLDELNSVKYEYVMTEDEKSRYYMRPDLFCYDKYNDFNLDFIILAINDILSDKEFTKTTVYMIDPDYMVPLISEIINAEKNFIQLNRNNYKNGAF